MVSAVTKISDTVFSGAIKYTQIKPVIALPAGPDWCLSSGESCPAGRALRYIRHYLTSHTHGFHWLAKINLTRAVTVVETQRERKLPLC